MSDDLLRSVSKYRQSDTNKDSFSKGLCNFFYIVTNQCVVKCKLRVWVGWGVVYIIVGL